MRRKRANISRGMLFTWGMLTGLIFLFAVPQETSSRLQLTYARVFRWPLAAGRGITLTARPTSLPHDISRKDYQDLLATRHQLENKIDNLYAALREAREKNERLAKLREKPEWENMDFRLAKVITAADPAQNKVIINRGTDDGVAVGQFVVGLGEGDSVDLSVSVIGTITSVDAKTAKVKLITDPGDPRIVVSIANLNIRRFMEGRGNNTARISNVEKEHKVSVGDPVHAQDGTGLDVPIITARVTRCQVDRDNPLFWDITVEPVCDLAGLSEVAVVIAPVPSPP